MGKHLFRGILVLLTGLGCVIWPQSANEIIIKILGSAIICAGLLDLVFALASRRFSQMNAGTVLSMCGTAALLVIGIVIIAKADVMVRIIGYIFGAVLVVSGIFQILLTYRVLSAIHNGVYNFALPLIIAVAGVLFLCDVINPGYVTVIFGICLIVTGVKEFMLGIQEKKIERLHKDESAAEAERIRLRGEAEDAETVG